MIYDKNTVNAVIVAGIVVVAISIALETDAQGILPLSLRDNAATPTSTNKIEQEMLKPRTHVLDVPFILEAPHGNWVEPWINACEESSVAMVEKYYENKKVVGVDEAMSFMTKLFTVQNMLYGSNMNSDTKRTTHLINNYSNFKGIIKQYPTIEEIKSELDNGRPVISFHYGFDLKNPNLNFLATGSSFHVLVVKGYDDEKKEFITNDPGDRKEGEGRRYGYDLFMNSLHDYVHTTYKANGPAAVIFTHDN